MGSGLWKIEPARPTEIKLMLELWKSIPGIGVGRGDEVKALRIFMDRNPSTCLVLKEQQRLVGTVMGGFDGRRGYLYHLAVHPDCRRKGYGQALLARVLDELKCLGAQKIHLFVFDDNQTAINFYRRAGWNQRRDIQVMSWDIVNLQEAKENGN
jgi:ribosomal protein S18 acetylase RimI-like enzyme